jgi:TonB family protein
MSLGSNDNKQYGAPDFERYYSGQMTEQEMHALEKAALDDPFLADALEGYNATRTPAADVTWLREQLAAKTQETKVVPLAPKRSYPFLRIAALVLLLLGAGWSAYYLMDNRKDTLALEHKEEQAVPAPTAPAAVAVPDSLQQQTMSVQAESAPATVTPTTTPTRQPSGKSAEKTEEAPAVAAAAPVREIKDADSAPPMLLREQEGREVAAAARKQTVPQALEGRAAGVHLNQNGDTPGQDNRIRIRGASTLNTFQGRVVDANQQGVAGATVSLLNNRTAVATDDRGYFTLNVPDTLIAANVAAIGFQSQNVTLNRQHKENHIVLQESTSALNEVVVVGYGTKRKRAVTGAVSSSLPRPAEGWERFEEYLQKHRKGANELAPKGLKGSVVLSFEVSRKGTPTDIKVDSSLSPSYDAEAIRLLREGPKWNRVKGTRGKVTIPFQ